MSCQRAVKKKYFINYKYIYINIYIYNFLAHNILINGSINIFKQKQYNK